MVNARADRPGETGLSEILRTGRLELRPFSASDGPAVFDYSRDPDWARYQQTTPASEQEADGIVADMLRHDWVEQPTFAITLSGVVVGLVALTFSADNQIALLGYGIHREHRGLGLTGEAVSAVLAEAFSVAGHPSSQPPYDTFWGSRYAILEDPDGNHVGLMSPPEDARRRAPPDI